MDIREKFAVAFKGEPEKTFIKSGIMNVDETLTSDGEAIFAAYLFKKFRDDFKASVVDVLLAEDTVKTE